MAKKPRGRPFTKRGTARARVIPKKPLKRASLSHPVAKRSSINGIGALNSTQFTTKAPSNPIVHEPFRTQNTPNVGVPSTYGTVSHEDYDQLMGDIEHVRKVLKDITDQNADLKRFAVDTKNATAGTMLDWFKDKAKLAATVGGITLLSQTLGNPSFLSSVAQKGFWGNLENIGQQGLGAWYDQSVSGRSDSMQTVKNFVGDDIFRAAGALATTLGVWTVTANTGISSNVAHKAIESFNKREPGAGERAIQSSLKQALRNYYSQRGLYANGQTSRTGVPDSSVNRTRTLVSSQLGKAISPAGKLHQQRQADRDEFRFNLAASLLDLNEKAKDRGYSLERVNAANVPSFKEEEPTTSVTNQLKDHAKNGAISAGVAMMLGGPTYAVGSLIGTSSRMITTALQGRTDKDLDEPTRKSNKKWKIGAALAGLTTASALAINYATNGAVNDAMGFSSDANVTLNSTGEDGRPVFGPQPAPGVSKSSGWFSSNWLGSSNQQTKAKDTGYRPWFSKQNPANEVHGDRSITQAAVDGMDGKTANALAVVGTAGAFSGIYSLVSSINEYFVQSGDVEDPTVEKDDSEDKITNWALMRTEEWIADQHGWNEVFDDMVEYFDSVKLGGEVSMQQDDVVAQVDVTDKLKAIVGEGEAGNSINGTKLKELLKHNPKGISGDQLKRLGDIAEQHISPDQPKVTVQKKIQDAVVGNLKEYNEYIKSLTV